MKTLKEFMASRKYVAVRYDKESQEKLREWAIKNGFDLSVKYGGEKQDPSDFVFHTTIFYSINESIIRNKISKIRPTEVTIVGIEFLGENQDIPVFKIELSDEIANLRKNFEEIGLNDKWPTYKPHISISYVREKRDVSKLKLPTFKPKYDTLIIEDIKE